jgi:hypothetical protein
MARTRQKRDEGGEGKVLKLPMKQATGVMSREEVLETLEKAGLGLDPQVVRFMRVPNRLMKGMNEKFEFFDTLSAQPIPSAQEDLPSYCFEKGKPAPAWITSWYMSIAPAEGHIKLTFIDKGREVFLREDYSDQREIAQKIYRKMGQDTIG